MYIFKKCPWLNIFSSDACNDYFNMVIIVRLVYKIWISVFHFDLSFTLICVLHSTYIPLVRPYFLIRNCVRMNTRRERIYYQQIDFLVFVQSGFVELRKKKRENYTTIVYFVQRAAPTIKFTICKLTTKIDALNV